MNAKTDTPATAVATGDKIPFGDVSADGWDTITVDKAAKALAEISDDPFGTLAELYGGEGQWAFRTTGRGLVIALMGDSNTKGRPGFESATNSALKMELTYEGGVWEDATVSNKGMNGSTLANWVATIGTGSGASTADGDIWSVKNLDPDMIVYRLGTNDVNNATARSTTGTEASLRANTLTAIRWLLDNTRATIIVRVPRLSWNGETDSFGAGIPGWADVNDYREAQRRLNVVHREWRGRTSRVIVIDTAKYLGDDYCNDKTANQLDPVTGVATMGDSLHDNDVGYRIEAMLIANAVSPVRYPVPRAAAAVIVDPEESTRDSYWSMTAYARARSANLLAFDLDPTAAITDGSTGLKLIAARPGPVTRLREAELLRCSMNSAVYHTLRNLPTVTGGYGLVYRDSGRVYTFDSCTFSSLTTADDPDYATFTIGGISPAWDAGDTSGPVKIFARTARSIPFSPHSSKVVVDRQIVIPGGQTDGSCPLFWTGTTMLALVRGLVTRALAWTGNVTIELRQCNLGDGRYVNPSDPGGSPAGTYSAGKVFGRVTLSAGIYQGTFTLDPDGLYATYPGSLLFDNTDFVRAVVTSGTVAGDINTVLAFR